MVAISHGQLLVMNRRRPFDAEGGLAVLRDEYAGRVPSYPA